MLWNVFVDGKQLNIIDKFTYLGLVISSNSEMYKKKKRKEIRIAKASAEFEKL